MSYLPPSVSIYTDSRRGEGMFWRPARSVDIYRHHGPAGAVRGGRTAVPADAAAAIGAVDVSTYADNSKRPAPSAETRPRSLQQRNPTSSHV